MSSISTPQQARTKLNFGRFKRPLGWKRESGEYDGISQFNFYRGEFADQEHKVPACIKPFMDEVTAFANVCENIKTGILLLTG